MPGREIRPGLSLPEDLVEIAFSRSGGPGGQHVNRTETRVTARLAVARIPGLSDGERTRILERLGPRLTGDGELLVTSSETRSRHRNEQDALDRMAALLAAALRPRKRRRPTRPTRASKERRLKEKKVRGERKRDRRPPGD